MTKITERIFDAITNETIDIERDMTAQELAESQEWENYVATKAQAQATAQAQKQALLNRLGITADEAKLLLS